jgi:hypothetical protein
LNVHEEITLKDIFAFLILLRLFVRLVVFPTKGSPAFATVNISDGVVACRHWAVVRLAFDDIYHAIE